MPNPIRTLDRSQKIAIMVALDAVCLPALFYLALCLRSSELVPLHVTAVAAGLFVSVGCVLALGLSGLYLSIIRFLDARILMRAASGLLAVLVLAHAVLHAISDFPLAALWIFGSMAFSYVAITRFFARSLLRKRARHGAKPALTVIYGAGQAGVHLAQSMFASRDYEPIFFVDDDVGLQGRFVAGLRVHSLSYLESRVSSERIDMMVVALPSISARRRQEILTRLESLSLSTRVLPSINELVDGKVSLSALRGVELPDLLGREPVPPRADLFARNITGKSVLVTGAGGSIGSELCRQVVSQSPSRLVLFDHSEFALYSIDHELRTVAPSLEIVTVLGSITNAELLHRVMQQNAVHTVYHAAAYKHVPLVEANVLPGIENNVFGSLLVAQAAVASKVQACILISTDKAVRPTNVMGTTKRVAEQIFQAMAASGAPVKFSMVRFGNVLGSSGSVVPLFRNQIKSGGPITLTHQDINRFFMLIPEAAQLVIQAGAMAQGGEVFVLDMGEPVKIIDLARKMIHLSGMTEKTPERPEGDIAIKIIGLRPGEKLYEELLLGSHVEESAHPKIRCAAEAHLPWAELSELLGRLRRACDVDDIPAMLALLRVLVPEYTPQVPAAD
jgi:FlaA1/EpsC-like NDP-sugar epimerase